MAATDHQRADIQRVDTQGDIALAPPVIALALEEAFHLEEGIAAVEAAVVDAALVEGVDVTKAEAVGATLLEDRM